MVDLGCSVISVDSAEQALESLGSDEVDLILSDVVMPGMSGLELARRVRETRPGIPVLLATGYSNEIMERGFECAVLGKPFGAADLSRAMSALLIESGISRPKTSAAARG
ncbi:response regulator [Sphingomonas daechungensis]|uniref:response regulator n=1 Tax=Sphingomonas daechungensis TaxID=1176646 RepID=UPI0021D53773|nr:response regulator [Sphingomonas daechungensis]